MSRVERKPRKRHVVRPRWVWGGLLLAVAGACLLGLGIARLGLIGSIVGTVILVAGAGAALFGGVLYDARVTSAGITDELHEIGQGESHTGIAPSDTAGGEAARLRAAAVTRRTRALQQATSDTPRGPWATVGAALVLVGAGVTLITQVMPYQLTGHSSNGVGSLIPALVATLAGIRVLVASGRHPWAAACAVGSGVFLVLIALTFGHPTPMPWFEGVCGALLIVGGALFTSTGDR